MFDHKEINKVWKQVQQIKHCNNSKLSRTLKHNDKLIFNDQEKAEIFANTLSKNSSFDILPQSWPPETAFRRLLPHSHPRQKPYQKLWSHLLKPNLGKYLYHINTAFNKNTFTITNILPHCTSILDNHFCGQLFHFIWKK